jgi:hypothetical protein
MRLLGQERHDDARGGLVAGQGCTRPPVSCKPQAAKDTNRSHLRGLRGLRLLRLLRMRGLQVGSSNPPTHRTDQTNALSLHSAPGQVMTRGVASGVASLKSISSVTSAARSCRTLKVRRPLHAFPCLVAARLPVQSSAQWLAPEHCSWARCARPGTRHPSPRPWRFPSFFQATPSLSVTRCGSSFLVPCFTRRSNCFLICFATYPDSMAIECRLRRERRLEKR